MPPALPDFIFYSGLHAGVVIASSMLALAALCRAIVSRRRGERRVLSVVLAASVTYGLFVGAPVSEKYLAAQPACVQSLLNAYGPLANPPTRLLAWHGAWQCGGAANSVAADFAGSGDAYLAVTAEPVRYRVRELRGGNMFSDVSVEDDGPLTEQDLASFIQRNACRGDAVRHTLAAERPQVITHSIAALIDKKCVQENRREEALNDQIRALASDHPYSNSES